MNPSVLLTLALLVGPSVANASECGWNADHTFYDCGDPFSGRSVGGSAPDLGDSLESNPAAFPSEPTPLGLEGSATNRAAPKGKPKLQASTVKGFDGLGFGIGSWSEGTFGAPDFDNHFLGSSVAPAYQNYQANPPSVLGFRLGGAVVLPKFFLPKGIRFSLGGSAGLGRVHGDFAPQVGILLRFFGLGIGYSENFEHISTLLPKTKISAFSIGMPLGPLYFGYSYITMVSSVNKTFANVYGMRWSSSGWLIYGNMKVQKDYRGGSDIWFRSGIIRHIGKRLGVGYENGLYRYSHSILVQLYL